MSQTPEYIIYPDEKLSGKIYLRHGKTPARIILRFRHDAVKRVHELFNMPIEIRKGSLRYAYTTIQYEGNKTNIGIDTISKVIASKNIDRLEFINNYSTYDGVLEVRAEDIEEAYKELVEKWKQEMEERKKRETMRKKLQEIISKHEIDKIIDIPLHIADNTGTTEELYDELIHYLVDEIKSLKQKLEYEARENNELNDKIEELEQQIETLRDFITDNDLAEKFAEWYKQKRKEEIDSELEEEAREILGIEEEDYD